METNGAFRSRETLTPGETRPAGQFSNSEKPSHKLKLELDRLAHRHNKQSQSRRPATVVRASCYANRAYNQPKKRGQSAQSEFGEGRARPQGEHGQIGPRRASDSRGEC